MLWLVLDYWQSFAAFCLFGLFHSVTAREPFKNALARWTSPFLVDHYWRLLYCLISFFWFYQIVGTLHWGLHPANNAWLIDYPDWIWQIITSIHLGSIAIFYAAALQSDYLEFLGLKQAWRGALAAFSLPEPRTALKQFGARSLEVHGVYGWVRHPMLLSGLLFFMTSGPTLNTFAFAIMYALYMVIGCHYEERHLVQIFGLDYVAYRGRVGAFFPRLWSVARPIIERT
jgi:protein-S-isoprenylcysteine O-methyltransferase Ste14